MNAHLTDLLARMHALEEEVEEEYRKARQEWATRQAQLADEFLLHQQRYKTGLLQFLRTSRLLVVLTAPVIYSGWLAFMAMDLFVTAYQALCFPVYGIPKVRRRDFLVFDRAELPYLNIIEKFNCFYCSYGNGVAAYAREVAARTEQYWCPIKHAHRVKAVHERYAHFFNYGDAEAYRQGLERLRQNYEVQERGGKGQHHPTDEKPRGEKKMVGRE